MKRLGYFRWVIILFLSVLYSKNSNELMAKVYYVSIAGNNSDSGTFNQPWASWQKAFNMVNAGDTVYIRGGTYKTTYIGYGATVDNKHGTADEPICIFNYPGEKPVFDLKGMVIGSFSFGIKWNSCSYWHVKGIEIRKIMQPSGGYSEGGLVIRDCKNFTFEECTVDSIQGAGFVQGGNVGNNYFIKCDSYDNYDEFTPGYPGGNADGFDFMDAARETTYVKKCRAWHNSDDGFDTWGNEGVIYFDSCWSWCNGYDGGDGHGFKYGNTFEEPLERNQRTTRNCIAFLNKTSGFYQNEGNIMMEFYNNISYKNAYRGYSFGQFCGTIVTFKNNISYNNGSKDVFCASTIHNQNSWDAIPSIIITDAEFKSIDTTGVTGTRGNNGELPVLNFIRPAEGSNLIDAGFDVGLNFRGNAPDIGAFEYVIPDDTIPIDIPNVSFIPNQTINKGDTFTSIILDDFVYDINFPDNEINWTISGNKKLIININTNSRIASIVNPDPEWTGIETTTFTATNPNGLFSSVEAIFTVAIVNNSPEIKDQEFIISLKEFNNNYIGKVLASDPDTDQILLCSIISGNELGLFKLETENGDLTTTTNFDVSHFLSEYNLTIMVEDNSEFTKRDTAIIKVIFLPKQSTFYVDPTNINDLSSDGTLEHPFNSWNNLTWKDSCTYLQKKGTTSYESKINIYASNVTLGSYGEGELPIIHSTANDFAIRAFQKNYLNIKDLHIIASGAVSCVYILGSTEENKIENCILEDAEDGVRIIDSKSVTICYNTFINCSSAIFSFAESNKIYYNVFRNNQTAINITSYLASTEIYNNVFYGNHTGISVSYSDLTLYNNIFYLENTGDMAINVKMDKFISDNNIFYPEQDGFISVSDRKYSTLIEFQQNLGLDLKSFGLDPQFRDVYNNNFAVNINSPAIDAGMDVGLGTDYYGTMVPYGKSADIGLAEAIDPLNSPITTVELFDVDDNQQSLAVFPNPSDGRFNINLEGINKEALKTSIIDITGKIIFEKFYYPGDLELFLYVDISHIPKGIYLVILNEVNKKYYQRIIIK